MTHDCNFMIRILFERHSGALERSLGFFSACGISIDACSMAPAPCDDDDSLLLTFRTEAHVARCLRYKISRLVGVVYVRMYETTPTTVPVITLELVKVVASRSIDRQRVHLSVKRCDFLQIIDISAKFITIQFCGSALEHRNFELNFQQFDIVERVRTPFLTI